MAEKGIGPYWVGALLGLTRTDVECAHDVEENRMIGHLQPKIKPTPRAIWPS